MTAFAGEMFVRAFERKSRFEMIEIGGVRIRAPQTQNRCKALQYACDRPAEFTVLAVHRSDSSRLFELWSSMQHVYLFEIDRFKIARVVATLAIASKASVVFVVSGVTAKTIAR